MAISFSDNQVKYYSIAASAQHNWCGVTKASLWYFLRIDSANPASIPLGPGGEGPMYLGKQQYDYYINFFPTVTTSTVDSRFHVTGPGGNGSRDVSLSIGVVYGIALTWDGVAAQQTLWISGAPYTLSASSGPCTTSFAPMTLGLMLANPNVAFTVSKLYLLDGYAFSLADKTALLNGADPLTIGTSATWRGYYSLQGTNGQTPVHTDPGLSNAVDGTLNFASETGSGVALYSDPLVWTPSVTAHPYVAGCGSIIGFTFTSNIDGSLVIPSQILSTPTIAVNGVDQGSLVVPWGGAQTAVHQCQLFSTPGTPPIQIGPADVVTLTAPSAWCNTSAGSVAALSGPIANRSGASSMQVESKPKTLRVGADFGPSQEFYPFANAKYLGGIPGQFFSKIPPGLGYQLVNQPCESGLVLIVWDATKPLTPAIWQLSTPDPARVTITHLPQYDVTPSNGIGCQRVYQIAYVAGSDYETVPNGSVIWYGYTDPGYDGTSINYDNLWIYLAGEWSFDGSGNPVFDRSDQYALSRFYQSNIPSNIGCMRGYLPGAGESGTFPYPELIMPPSIECFWSDGAFAGQRFGYLSAGPVDVTATPWLYSSLFKLPGQSFTATLTDTISTAPAVGTNETWHFSDGATAPLMAGLEIQVDSEICRIISGSGTTWVVYRGSNNTTPATHSPGTVTVFGRTSIRAYVSANGTTPYSAPFLIQCDRPHGMTTLQGYSGGSLPSMTMIDGATGTTFTDSGPGLGQAFVTGPTSFVTIWSGWYATRPAGAKPSATVTLDPNVHFNQTQYAFRIPHQVFIEHVARFPDCNMHFNVPLDGVDDMYWVLARMVRDFFPAGRKIYIEWANEIWNGGAPFQANLYQSLMAPLAMPSGLRTYGLAYAAYRSTQAQAIFREVFTEAGRGNEILGLINCQMNSSSTQITPNLNFGLMMGQPFDVVSIAPYFTNNMSGSSTAATVAAIDQYNDDQVAEQFLHDFYYDTSGPATWLKNDKAAVDAYNAANGKNVIMTCYEAGPAQTIPATAFHASSRQHDITYNPNIYQFMLAYFQFLQDIGFVEFHEAGIGYGWPDAYPLYRMRTQKHSRGRGIGGESDNKHLCINPSNPGFFSGTPLKQDRHADSVTGQAFVDWLGFFLSPPPPIPPGNLALEDGTDILLEDGLSRIVLEVTGPPAFIPDADLSYVLLENSSHILLESLDSALLLDTPAVFAAYIATEDGFRILLESGDSLALEALQIFSVINLGRFRAGDVVPLAFGVPARPDYYPNVSVLPAGVDASPYSKDGRNFLWPLLIDSRFSLGTFIVTCSYSIAGVQAAQQVSFDVVDGGDAGSQVISMFSFERPKSKFVLAQLRAGSLVQGRNPHT